MTDYSIQPTITSIYSSEFSDFASDMMSIYSPSSTLFESSISTNNLMSWSIYTKSTNILSTSSLSTNTLGSSILSTDDSSTASFPTPSFPTPSPSDSSQPSFFSSFYIILLAVIGFIALLVLCLALTICITYWQYSK